MFSRCLRFTVMDDEFKSFTEVKVAATQETQQQTQFRYITKEVLHPDLLKGPVCKTLWHLAVSLLTATS